jgi:tetratricopeptide (TPR) repeat protein
LNSSKKAVELDPENGLAWARLAELQLSFGYLDKAMDAAHQAVNRNPNLARTQWVLGFAYLTQTKTGEAREAFGKAIRLDQAAPLPRLGLGLTNIRDGKLKAGREELEIAVSLDPNNALVRSYLGKAYYEEKRTDQDGPQLAIAKQLDPLDPTAWFYDAIRKQSVNRPVEAMQDFQKAIALNDNRAVYRSRLLLDEDLAARSASLARIYSDLGFEQLALVEGWRSVNTDPGNHSAHRFLADSYAVLPRHEIARASELLQSQLLQPINIRPVQPQLAGTTPFILEGAGPADPSFNTFGPLFNRNRLALQASGVLGQNETLGDEVIFSGVQGRYSFSLGQFHYQTDGFRENNDLEKDTYNAYLQGSLSFKTSIQAEFRYDEDDRGDLPLRFDPDDFDPTLKQKEQIRSLRFGFRHAFTPHSDLIASVIYRDADFDTKFSSSFAIPAPPGSVDVSTAVDLDTDEDGIMVEGQHLYRLERFHLTGGAGYFDADRKDVTTTTRESSPPIFPPSTEKTKDTSDIRHTNLYVYSQITYPEKFTWTIGGSADFLAGAIVDSDQFNPKLGLIWNPYASTTVRAALFRTLTRTLLSAQTLEPTQVAGFNQFFEDGEGTEAWRYGAAVDQKFTTAVYGGAELSGRDLDVQFEDPTLGRTEKADWQEKLARVYLYWTPHPWLVASGEYNYERLSRDQEFVGTLKLKEVDSHRVSLATRFFHPSGLFAGLKATYLDQNGEFGDPVGGDTMHGEDNFWVADASVGFRLPKRFGLITLEARNLFDEKFRFQETDPVSPSLYPERLIVGRITLSF